MSKKRLEDREYLFTLLVAVVKSNGGTIRISEEDLLRVVKGDSVSLSLDKVTKEIVLKCVSPKTGLFGILGNMASNRDDEYEN